MKSKILLGALLFYTLPAFAYIGPGMGGGILAVFIGFISSIFFGLVAIIYFPIKRLFKKKNTKRTNNKDQDDQEPKPGEGNI